MAEPRKVAFVTLSALTAAAPSPVSEARKRRLDVDTEPSLNREAGVGAPEAAGSGKVPGQSETVRMNITLPESTELSFPEFSYGELLQEKTALPAVSHTLHQVNNGPQHKQEVEDLGRKFGNKYGLICKRKHKDRVQDMIDIGFGYDESDSFIDNSEAYDELVPASLTTKLGGFYINTGTLQFRNASESESDDAETRCSRGDEDSVLKRRRDEEEVEEKRMKNNRLIKTAVARPEKKRRTKLVSARHFTQEKKETRKLNPNDITQLLHDDGLLTDLTSDPELQDLLNDLDYGALDTAPQTQHTENGLLYGGVGLTAVGRACLNQVVCPPPLPEGLSAPLVKRIEDLHVASRQFDAEGRKKFFTLDMNNILLDIELQVQEHAPSVRSAVYSHIEAFVPCNKEALLKRLKKLSHKIQDDRLRTPLLKLKLAVCSVMPEQTARYKQDCIAKVAAKQQVDGEGNVSEDEDEEKPGKRVMGPRKKFIWDEKLRSLLCNLVRVKLRCYEQEKSSLSVEDYLKAFMETEVKPLWPKGWMQARMLFKESRTVHGHLTDLGKKRLISTQRPARIKEVEWQLGPVPGVGPATFSTLPPSDTICLSDSLDEDLAVNSLDSITQALTLLNNSANGVNPDSTPVIPSSSLAVAKYHPHTVSPASSSQSSTLKDVPSVQRKMVTPASRPSNASTNTSPAAKPRPPPTTTPLQKPFGTIGLKSVQALPPVAQLKNTVNKLCDGAQQPGLKSVNPKNIQQLATPSSSPLLKKKATPIGQHQQRFITPMQATITKSSQSSSSPIIKLTPRPPIQATTPGSIHCPAAQATPPGSIHRPLVQAMPPGSTHQPAAQTTPSASTHRSPASTQHPPARSLTPGPTHRPPVQTTPAGPSHQAPTQALPPGSAHHSSISTPSPPGIAHNPTVSLSSSGNCPTVSTPQNLGHSHRSPVSSLTHSVSIHHSSVSTLPSPSSHRPSVQIPPSSSYRPSVPTPPPSLAHCSLVATPPSVSSPLTSSHPLVQTPPTQYSPKNSGFKPPYSTAPVTTPNTSTSSTNHGQRQKVVGGASQSNKSSANCASSVALPSLSDSALLNKVSSVPLGLGMFGGLVPVSLPFQFPLLNLAPPTASAHTPSSGYTLTPNLFKSLQSGVQAALPPHLQLAFSESNQSQGDMKRK